MGLLDNLFKPKPESGAKKIGESLPAEDLTPAGESVNPPAPAPRSPAFLSPKTYVPRASAQVVPPSRNHAQPMPAPASPAPAQSESKVIVLTLGDVLSRIPTQFLRQGMHDAKRELRFEMDDLSADIARGRAAVYLAHIVAQCPDIFLPETDGFDDMQIRLPLQKLVEQIGLARGHRTISIGEKGAPPPPVAKQAPEPLPAPAMETTRPAPVAHEPPAIAEIGGEKIHLSLAAILRRCPPEILVGELPPVDEKLRITFPFAPIERQLASGKVEVTSMRFIAALPPALLPFFEAQDGVKVPLPLEEIFQNLPGNPLPSAVEVEAALPAAKPEPEPIPAPIFEAKAPEPPVELPHPAPAPPAVEAVEPSAPEPVLPVSEIIEESTPPAELQPFRFPESVVIPVEEPFVPSGPPPLLAPTPAAGPTILAPEPVADVAPEPVHVESIAPPPVEPVLPEPVVEAPAPPVVESTAFRAMLPPLRPPTLMRPDFMPAPPIVAPPAPAPPSAFQPPPEAVSPPAETPQPEPPKPEPVIPPVLPPDREPETVAPEPTAPILPGFIPHIGPPLVRPVMTLPPPIFMQPAGGIPAPVAPEPEPPIQEEAPAMVAMEEPIPEPLPSSVLVTPEPEMTSESSGNEPIEESVAALKVHDLAHLSRTLSSLPGIQACVLSAGTATAHGGELPDGLDRDSLRELGQQMSGALAPRTGRLNAGAVQHLTLHGERFSLSLFTRGDACVCAVHRARIFLPGVRERFAAAAEELA